MKKLILSATIVASFSGVSFAQDARVAPAVATAAATQTQAQPVKTQIAEADLPEGIKTTLASDQYKEWKVSTAWLVTEGANEYYVVEMSKGEERSTLKLNKEGQAI